MSASNEQRRRTAELIAPHDRKLIEDVMAQHPGLRAPKAIECAQIGGLNLSSPERASCWPNVRENDDNKEDPCPSRKLYPRVTMM